MEITKRDTVYQGHYRLQVYTVKDGDQEFKREVYQTGQAAAALVYDTQKQKFILAKQYRPAVERELLEAVAGMLDSEGEKPEDAITREIEEEIGYAVDKLELISEFYPSPGAFSEKIYLFYAEVSRQTSAGGGKDEENESIKAVEMSTQELLAHRFTDGKTIMAVQWLKLAGLPAPTK
ncbi:NUDIX domain-containing protein [Rufibacter quisquiliarum]|uniref:GDP-mannose pyrophosphatase n=1 Tax=Rufibacter quisquiliarum TaxID=1549639 RepID=A0A839GQ82_9BACT|nr:NUDIX hydrolase [Rufibacter quisquiliarum]MBA9077036.1 ADP-ribose pyrophosphatase [Rufibacter quisquiliarum]